MPPQMAMHMFGGGVSRMPTPQVENPEDLGYDFSKDYDHQAAAAAGVPFNPAQGQHGDSRFKADWHERRFLPSPLGVFDTKNSVIVPMAEFQAQATPIQKLFFHNTQESVPAADVQTFMAEALRRK